MPVLQVLLQQAGEGRLRRRPLLRPQGALGGLPVGIDRARRRSRLERAAGAEGETAGEHQ
jgi:hypothetical protein